MSPIDPIFWMHHCNIDRIWHIWTRRQSALNLPTLPPEPAWKTEPFQFFCDDQGRLLNKTAADYSTIEQLGYNYEAGSAEELASPEVAVSVAGQNLTFESAAFTPESFRTFREIGANIRLPNDTLVAARTSAAHRTADEDKLAAHLQAIISIKPPSDAQKVRIRVFANCSYLSRNTPISDPHFVGTISFFGVNHGKHHGHGAVATYTLNLAQTIKALANSGQPIRNQLRLQFMAIDDLGKVRELDGGLANVEIKAI